MVAFPPAFSIPSFSASATILGLNKYSIYDRSMLLTFGNMAVQGVDDDGDFGGRHIL
jgi:hypothetical protein